jgi:hypothetical protein
LSIDCCSMIGGPRLLMLHRTGRGRADGIGREVRSPTTKVGED